MNCLTPEREEVSSTVSMLNISFLRFPLDHVFCSADFTLTSIKRMNSCGSDHFPMCINLQYDRSSISKNDIPEAEQEDLELFREKVNADTA